MKVISHVCGVLLRMTSCLLGSFQHCALSGDRGQWSACLLQSHWEQRRGEGQVGSEDWHQNGVHRKLRVTVHLPHIYLKSTSLLFLKLCSTWASALFSVAVPKIWNKLHCLKTIWKYTNHLQKSQDMLFQSCISTRNIMLNDSGFKGFKHYIINVIIAMSTSSLPHIYLTSTSHI